MSPKSLLRTAASYSDLSEMTDGSFQKVLADPRDPDPDAVKRVVLCSGKVFYEVDRQREDVDLDVALLRVEELYPFAAAEIVDAVARYRNADEVAWLQEEPENMGAWPFLRARIQEALDRSVAVIARRESPSPASGSSQLHAAEQQDLVNRALKV